MYVLDTPEFGLYIFARDINVMPQLLLPAGATCELEMVRYEGNNLPI